MGMQHVFTEVEKVIQYHKEKKTEAIWETNCFLQWS